MAVIIIPVAVSMHTVTSLIFASTLRESWRSTMFPAFFVAGALYSGTGVIIICKPSAKMGQIGGVENPRV